MTITSDTHEATDRLSLVPSPVEAPDLWLGTATLSPGGPVVAGSMGAYTLTYRVGRYGVDNGGSIKIAIRMACDWGRPQLDDPLGEGYTTVHTTSPARLRCAVSSRGYIRPFSNTLTIEVWDEPLAEGDEIVVVWGDTSKGSPGSRAQTFVDEAFEFRVLVDCFGTQEYRRLPTSPVFRVISGPLARYRLVAPSTAVVGQAITGTLHGEDQFGNPIDGFPLPATLVAEGPATATGRVEANPAGPVPWSGVQLAEPGTYVLVARAADGSELVRSNPIRVTASAPQWRICWGDTQGQSGATVGTGDLDSFFRYAQHDAALDFIVHSANDFQITDEFHRATCEAVKRYHQPGRFVTFLSYEWSGNTPGGGDHTVIFLNDDEPIHRSSQWQLPNGKDDGTDRYPVSELWETYRGQTNMLAIPHVGGRYAKVDFYDAEFCPVLEITSVHGRFNWFAEEYLARGYRVGFVGASDDHSGRPGVSAPTSRPDMGHHGGMAAVYATENTREAIWEALWARRCYGTTSPRLLLWTEMAGQPMGAECTVTSAPRLRVRATGTAPLEYVEILRDTTVVHRLNLRPPARPESRLLRVAWSGARLRGRGRAAHWHGGLILSGGTIRSATAWGFETPGQGLTHQDAHQVRWHSTTGGDPDGVLLDVDASPAAVLSFETEPATFSIRLAEIEAGPHIVAAGGVEQQVEVGWVSPQAGPAEVDFEWDDTDAPVGIHAYWVRLLQADTHAAWASPIFATVQP